MARNIAKEPKKKSVIDLKSQQKIYKTVSIKIRRGTGVIEALEESLKKTGTPPATYIQIALREKLIRDGYLSAESVTPEE